MTSTNPKSDAHAMLGEEVKELKRKCAETYNVIQNNMPMEMQDISAENVEGKSLCYLEGIRADIDATETSVETDKNLLTSKFLNELSENIQQLEDIIAFKRGLILDMNTKISSLKSQIKIAEEAKTKPLAEKMEVKPEHILKAKQKFQFMKTELHGLIHSLYPNQADDMMETLGELMQEKLAETSSGYIEVSPERYPLIQLLQDMGLLTAKPYDKLQVKLAY